ncbi:GNAT family N-acetyltransferase [Tropicibacter naphthalenivorans]|uniref:Putative N-acetyltransferase YjcF n=1 Tax=Tropicibacter naphthalenivorans TaxID=441103 RepID=A0A0P1FZK4_9RHOB|nr:GNAT family N-acetyltransferase [Tropicibacter naphthalenivorans]CUH74735.1 putative N-acetyltransferase YjcF [Tropicibacter naphthalenivorans]SMC49461.1 ElaA protein [Tropicibacter naphthalenivorans]
MTVSVATDPAECFALRRTVFIEEQGFTEADEWDDLDASAVHLVKHVKDQPVATARLIPQGDAGRIGRICVLKTARGLGLGAELVRYGIEYFASKGAKRVVLGAQVRAQGFYAKLGFTPIGAVYDDGGVPHQEMERAL